MRLLLSVFLGSLIGAETMYIQAPKKHMRLTTFQNKPPRRAKVSCFNSTRVSNQPHFPPPSRLHSSLLELVQLRHQLPEAVLHLDAQRQHPLRGRPVCVWRVMCAEGAVQSINREPTHLFVCIRSHRHRRHRRQRADQRTHQRRGGRRRRRRRPYPWP